MQGMLNTPMSSISHSHSHSHSRKHSGELDVFEATRYFSGVADAHKTAAWRAMGGDRRSLDMPLVVKVPQPHQKVELMSHNMVKDKVKFKQSCSPGGKLASFLNNFFQQYSNSKKSKKSSSPKPVKSDQEESNSRRKRRSSMSCSTIHHESKSCYYSSSCSSSSSTSGFRAPPLNNNSKNKRMSNGFKDNNGVSIWGDEFRLKMRHGDELKIKKEEKFEFRDHDLVDDDSGESDSSSDLFELKINLCEFGEINSSGLPVYGSTDVGVIRSRERFASTVAY